MLICDNILTLCVHKMFTVVLLLFRNLFKKLILAGLGRRLDWLRPKWDQSEAKSAVMAHKTHWKY